MIQQKTHGPSYYEGGDYKSRKNGVEFRFYVILMSSIIPLINVFLLEFRYGLHFQ